MPGRPHLTLAGLLLAPVLAGCGGPVEVDVPDLSAADRAACQAVIADLPQTLLHEERADIEPANAPAAAYGDPAIVVRCGVGQPTDFGDAAQCEVANGVPLFIPPDQYDDQSLDLEITTAWHRPRVEVTLPRRYRGSEAEVMVTLAELATDHLRETGTCAL